MEHIRYCPACKKYTLREVCLCGTVTILRKPMKYSSDDSGRKYRVKEILQMYRNKKK